VLTGDIHSSWAADLHPNPYNPALYDKATGAGSLAVEFVGTSVTSPGVDTDTSGAVAGAIRFYNPHLKYVQLTRRGYLLMDVNRDRVVGEWWYVDTVASPSNVESFATAFEVRTGENRLRPSAQTPHRANPPALAP
jgi:alkaline phosphatase D